MNSIRKFAIKCKFYLKIAQSQEDVFVALLITLIGFGGFGLGRLSVLKETREPISIVQNENNFATPAALGTAHTPGITRDGFSGAKEAGSVVGSINGTKYHLPECPGATQIKEENKIWFPSAEDAQKAGYTPASNCKGL